MNELDNMSSKGLIQNEKGFVISTSINKSAPTTTMTCARFFKRIHPRMVSIGGCARIVVVVSRNDASSNKKAHVHNAHTAPFLNSNGCEPRQETHARRASHCYHMTHESRIKRQLSNTNKTHKQRPTAEQQPTQNAKTQRQPQGTHLTKAPKQAGKETGLVLGLLQRCKFLSFCMLFMRQNM